MRLLFVVSLMCLVGCPLFPTPVGDIECTVDADCFEGAVCNTILGICEFIGEGEGEGEPQPQCTLDAFAEPNGDGALFITSGFLDVDFENFAGCTEGAPYLASFLADRFVNADFSGNEVRFSADGGPPSACNGRPQSDGTFVVCPICFVVAPEELAIQLEGDDGALSNATCVDVGAV